MKTPKMWDICGKKHSKTFCFQFENDSKTNVDKSDISISHCDKNSTNNVQIENIYCNIFLQTCSDIFKDPENNKNEPFGVLLDNGKMKTFILREKLKLLVVRKETLSV